MAKIFLEIGCSASRNFGYRPELLEAGDSLVAVDPFTDRGLRGRGLGKPQRVYASSQSVVPDDEKHSPAIQSAMRSNVSFEQRTRRSGVHYSAIHADGQQLPFGDGSVHEVLLQNVIGDADVPDNECNRMLSESLRVVGAMGLVRCVETYTPDVALARIEAFERLHPEQKLADIEFVTIPTGNNLARYAIHGIEQFGESAVVSFYAS